MKITNSMIKSCRLAINGTGTCECARAPSDSWRCSRRLRMNEFYQEQYKLTKDKLAQMPTGRQFDFAEGAVVRQVRPVLSAVDQVD